MRVPVAAGRKYSLEPDTLRSEIGMCFSKGSGEPKSCADEHRIKAVMVPYADVSCSGCCSSYAYKAIAEDGLPDAYVIIAPDNHNLPYDYVMSCDDYCTPLGMCPIHEDIASRLKKLIPDDSHAHQLEYSIEVQLPFIQHIDRNPKIVPIIMGRHSLTAAKQLAKAV